VSDANARLADEHATVVKLADYERQLEVRLAAGKESESPNFKGSDLGRFPLVSADLWTSDHLSERSRSVDAFFWNARARNTHVEANLNHSFPAQVRLAAALADHEAQKDHALHLAERCQVAERRAADAALALSKSIAEQDLLIKRANRAAAVPVA
jgi:hypothetical protein